MQVDFEKLITSIHQEVSHTPTHGTVANYIPELSSVSPKKFGAHLLTLQGAQFGVGDCEEKFSIQSIAKVFSLALAFQQKGEALWTRVGVEPSGNSFNSLWQLEYEKGIPRNPLINSGAIVICDILCSLFPNPKQVLLHFVREIAQTVEIHFNEQVASSEKHLGFRNAALINMMKASRNIQNEIEDVLDLYYHLCSIEMSCKELASAFILFANHGRLAGTDKEVITSSMAKRINAIMQTCGFYDEAGEYTFRVGLPGKSGIGGGIAANHPGHYAVAVWSPPLNKKGNSVKGMQFLEMLTTRTGVSIF